MFSLFNFSSIFPGGQLTPFAPMRGRPCVKIIADKVTPSRRRGVNQLSGAVWLKLPNAQEASVRAGWASQTSGDGSIWLREKTTPPPPPPIRDGAVSTA